MNISRLSAIRVIQNLKKIEMIAKKFEKICFRKKHWRNGSFCELLFVFWG